MHLNLRAPEKDHPGACWQQPRSCGWDTGRRSGWRIRGASFPILRSLPRISKIVLRSELTLQPVFVSPPSSFWECQSARCRNLGEQRSLKTSSGWRPGQSPTLGIKGQVSRRSGFRGALSPQSMGEACSGTPCRKLGSG